MLNNNMMNLNNMGMNNFQWFPNNINNMNEIQGMPMMNIMQKDITNIQEANIIIKQLINYIMYLQNKMNKFEEKMKKFEQYKNRMDLNCYYNQFDVKAYKLNDIYCKLESKKIIKKQDEFGLINKAIRHLFNKNIKDFIFVYEFKEDAFEPVVFKHLFNGLTYSVLIISIQEQNNNRRFGAFINKNMNNIMGNMNMNNMNVNMMNQNMEHNNPMMGEIMMNHLNNFANPMNPMGMQGNFANQTTDQNNNNNLEIENIFNSYSNPSNSFIFSLDSLNIYYKEDINKYYPGFSITYNTKFKRLLGEEIANMGEIEPYKLSGKKEFIIESLELYEIKI